MKSVSLLFSLFCYVKMLLKCKIIIFFKKDLKRWQVPVYFPQLPPCLDGKWLRVCAVLTKLSSDTIWYHFL